MRIFAALALAIFISGTGGASAQVNERPRVSAREAAASLMYYYKLQPNIVKNALKEHGLYLSDTPSAAPLRRNGNVQRQLNNLPGTFTRIEDINRASFMMPYEDRKAIYREAGRFIQVDLDDISMHSVKHDAEAFCGRHFRRIGEKEAFGTCLFRHVTTIHTFNEDTDQCRRDVTVLLEDRPDKDDLSRDIYLCVRKKGWRDAQEVTANIDLPVARDD